MKKQSKNLIFFGNERVLTGIENIKTPVFSEIIKNGYNILAVFLENKPTVSRKTKINPIIEIAQKNKIPIYSSLENSEILEKIHDLKPDIGVLVSYGKILKSDIIGAIPHGIVNIHPSMLPKYRGTTPIETAIQNGDSQIGISLMKLTEGMDSGPIYAQEIFTIKEDQSKLDIANKALEVGAKLLIKYLPGIISGSIIPTDQKEKYATFTKKIDKADSIILPMSDTAVNINNKIRALVGYPKPKVNINNRTLIITKSHISTTPSSLSFKCKDGVYIIIDNLVAPSGKEISSEDYLRGYKK